MKDNMTAKTKKKSKSANKKAKPSKKNCKLPVEFADWHASEIDFANGKTSRELLGRLLGKKAAKESARPTSPVLWLHSPEFTEETKQKIHFWHASVLCQEKRKRIAKEIIAEVQSLDVKVSNPNDALIAISALLCDSRDFWKV